MTHIQFPLVRSFLAHSEVLTRKTKSSFSLFQGRGGFDGRDWDDWFRVEVEVLKSVPVEMTETDEIFTALAEIPAFVEKDIGIEADAH